jgi:hypothetical protein
MQDFGWGRAESDGRGALSSDSATAGYLDKRNVEFGVLRCQLIDRRALGLGRKLSCQVVDQSLLHLAREGN